MPDLTLDTESGIPIYRQIVEQIRYLIEGGQLGPGEHLPPIRTLAVSLGVNRNTVARAYDTLRELELVTTRGSAGTTVATGLPARATRPDTPRHRPGSDLRTAVHAAVHSGLSPEQVRDTAFVMAQQVHAARRTTSHVVFAECNRERAQAFATELADRLGVDVRPCLIADLDRTAAGARLLVTTFFHLAEVQRWTRTAGVEIDTVAIVVAPHIRTLARIAELPGTALVGVRYSTRHQAEQVRDWLAAAGRAEVVVVPADRPVPADLTVLVVPSEDPGLAVGAARHTDVIDFGNVLDDGSITVVREVLDAALDRAPSAPR